MVNHMEGKAELARAHGNIASQLLWVLFDRRLCYFREETDHVDHLFEAPSRAQELSLYDTKIS